MAVDAALWLILAAMAGLVFCGCVYTRPRKVLYRHDGKSDRHNRA